MYEELWRITTFHMRISFSLKSIRILNLTDILMDDLKIYYLRTHTNYFEWGIFHLVQDTFLMLLYFFLLWDSNYGFLLFLVKNRFAILTVFITFVTFSYMPLNFFSDWIIRTYTHLASRAVYCMGAYALKHQLVLSLSFYCLRTSTFSLMSMLTCSIIQ